MINQNGNGKDKNCETTEDSPSYKQIIEDTIKKATGLN